jgi:transcription initiation factor TFIIIB Brf1 subunit/transcription initiation factor TFIIB
MITPSELTIELKVKLSMSILQRISIEEVLSVARMVWIDKKIADSVARETIQIINQTYRRKFVFFNGKSSRNIIGGLFYILGYRYNSIKKQKELADLLGTTEMTIRASYHKWLQAFPDLFGDVIGEFAKHKNLRYFVLLELNK